MISIEEATRHIAQFAVPRDREAIALADALGHVLAEDVACSLDSPPFDKALVDGYAVRAEDVRSDGPALRVLEEVTAGETPTRGVEPGCAIRIMTGAPIPRGAELVVMVERTETLNADGTQVKLLQTEAKVGEGILPRGKSMREGEVVIPSGQRIRPAEIGLLAELGHAKINVWRKPRVAVLATGNELVPAGEDLRPGQIRNSNGPMLLAYARRCGATPIDLGIGRDEPGDLRARLSTGLESADVLVVSGGVSAGVLDLVPGMLAELGVEKVFHKVQLKPGKPLWFGVAQQAAPPRLVFGLPGNPVSSLVCFELFMRPALERLSGQAAVENRRFTAVLSQAHPHDGGRPTYWPALLSFHGDAWRVEPLPWQGSGDLRTLTKANSLCFFPAGARTYAVGETVEVVKIQ